MDDSHSTYASLVTENDDNLDDLIDTGSAAVLEGMRMSRAEEEVQEEGEEGEGELVTIPLAKLQNLVEFGIQVLKESRSSHASHATRDVDLEQNVFRERQSSPGIPLNQNQFEASRRRIPPKHLDEFLARARANAWPLRKIEVDRDQVINLPFPGESFSRLDRRKFDIIWDKHFRGFFGYGHPDLSATEIVRREWFWKRILKECDREMTPWLLEIGTDDPDARATILIKILICISKAPSQNRYSSASTVGAILERCYAAGVLCQSGDIPLNSENSIFRTEMRQDYGIHIILIAISLNVFNDCLAEGNSDLGSNSGQILWSPTDLLKEACGGANLEQILAFTGPELVVAIISLSRTLSSSRLSKRPLMNAGRIDDLNIGSLRAIGGLRIVWTDIFEEHLSLDHQNKSLRIARLRPYIWGRLSIFQDDFIRWSSTYRQPHGPSVLRELKSDIERTWAILFSISAVGDSPRNKLRMRAKLRLEYESISDPDSHPIKTYNIQTLKDYHMPWIEDDSVSDKSDRVRLYYQSRWDDILGIIESKKSKRTIANSKFGMFEDRVRDLRRYMDQQKPHGLRQLLRDSRDALNYYTFMGVIIFGSLSILLALASLAVGIAQTYAAFKALDVSS